MMSLSKTLGMLALLLILSVVPCVATQPTPYPTIGPGYAGRFGVPVDVNATITPFNNGYFTTIVNNTFTNSTDNLNPGESIGTAITMYTDRFGSYFFLIFFAIIAAMFIIPQNNVLVPIGVFLLGSGLFIWYLPINIIGILSSLIIFAISLLVLRALKGRIVT